MVIYWLTVIKETIKTEVALKKYSAVTLWTVILYHGNFRESRDASCVPIWVKLLFLGLRSSDRWVQFYRGDGTRGEDGGDMYRSQTQRKRLSSQQHSIHGNVSPLWEWEGWCGGIYRFRNISPKTKTVSELGKSFFFWGGGIYSV